MQKIKELAKKVIVKTLDEMLDADFLDGHHLVSEFTISQQSQKQSAKHHKTAKMIFSKVKAYKNSKPLFNSN